MAGSKTNHVGQAPWLCRREQSPAAHHHSRCYKISLSKER